MFGRRPDDDGSPWADLIALVAGCLDFLVFAAACLVAFAVLRALVNLLR